MELQSITELVDTRPFRPFIVELDNGLRAAVRHPENILFIPNRAKLFHITVYDEEQNALVSFHPTAVSAIIKSDRNGRNGRKQKS